MNLSESFKFDEESKDPFKTLAYSLDSLVSNLELVYGHCEQPIFTDERRCHQILSDSISGVLETAKLCRQLAHGVSEPTDRLNIDMEHVREWAKRIRAEEEVEEREFTDEDERILADVDCMVSEVAVMLRFVVAEYAKQPRTDVEKKRAVTALEVLAGVLVNFENTFAVHQGPMLLDDMDTVLEIVGKHAHDLLSQTRDIYQHAYLLDSATDQDVLIHSAGRLLNEAARTLSRFKKRFKAGGGV